VPTVCARSQTALRTRTLLPPTGSSLTAVAPVLRSSCVAHGPMAPGGEADPGSQRRRRTPGDAAIPSTSPGLYPGPVPASGTSSRTAWLPSGGQAPGRHHAERHGRTKITRADPPFGTSWREGARLATAAHNGAICVRPRAWPTRLTDIRFWLMGERSHLGYAGDPAQPGRPAIRPRPVTAREPGRRDRPLRPVRTYPLPNASSRT
jgi:hypothetical protein